MVLLLRVVQQPDMTLQLDPIHLLMDLKMDLSVLKLVSK